MFPVKYSVRQGIVFALLFAILIGGTALLVRRTNLRNKYVTVEFIGSGGNWWEFLPQTPYWLAGSVSRGDRELATDGQVVAEILEIKTYEEGPNRAIYAKAKLLATPGSTSGSFRFRQQPLEVGSTITIHPNNVMLMGSVISIEGKHPQNLYKTIVVTTKLFDQKLWFSDAIHVGDIAIDSQGNTITKIINKSVESSLTTVGTPDGRIFIKKNPLLRDIALAIEIQVTERDGVLYFNQLQPVKVGNSIWIPLKNTDIKNATITAIDISDESTYSLNSKD